MLKSIMAGLVTLCILPLLIVVSPYVCQKYWLNYDKLLERYERWRKTYCVNMREILLGNEWYDNFR